MTYIPEVSIVLPVYNAEKYVKAAIESILNQTYKNFELLIFNDGSTDGSLQLIKEFDDERIKIFNYEQNIGLISVLNIALSEAKGEFIARMDADDVSIPIRLEEQVLFLKKNTEIGICGSFIKIIDSDEVVIKPTTDNELRWWIFRGSPFAHPSIMLRKEVIKRSGLKFNLNAYAVEDFEFWWQLAFYTKMGNIDKVLLNYRVHDEQVSTSKKEIQNKNYRISQSDFITSLGLNTHLIKPEFIDRLFSKTLVCNAKDLIITWNFFRDLQNNQKSIYFFGLEEINTEFKNQMIYLIKNLTQYNWTLLKFLFKRKFYHFLILTNVNPIVFFIKSMLKWKTKTIE